MVDKRHGKDGAIYLGGAAGGGGTKVAGKSEWSLQRNRDYVDVTSFGDTNKTYVAGLPNVQGNYNGFLDLSGDQLFRLSASGAQLIYLYADDGTNGGAVALVAHGSGFLDSTVNCTNTDAVKISGEFRASAGWVLDL
jgi:predicted secreted protein